MSNEPVAQAVLLEISRSCEDPFCCALQTTPLEWRLIGNSPFCPDPPAQSCASGLSNTADWQGRTCPAPNPPTPSCCGGVTATHLFFLVGGSASHSGSPSKKPTPTTLTVPTAPNQPASHHLQPNKLVEPTTTCGARRAASPEAWAGRRRRGPPPTATSGRCSSAATQTSSPRTGYS